MAFLNRKLGRDWPTLFLLVGVSLLATIATAVVKNRNLSTTRTSVGGTFQYHSMYLPIGSEPFTLAAADKVTFTLPDTVWVTDFSCAFQTKNGTVSAATIMLEKNGTNMLTSAIDLGGSAAAATPVAGVLSPSPFSLTASDKATIDVDSFTGGGNMYGMGCLLTYRSPQGSEGL